MIHPAFLTPSPTALAATLSVVAMSCKATNIAT